MALARRSRFQRTSGVRRKTSWTAGPKGTAGTITSNTQVIFPTGLQALLGGLTIVRLRGELLARIITSSAANDGFLEVALGIGVVSENAFAVGVTAVPHPVTDIDWDGWLYHRMFSLSSSAAVSAAGASTNGMFSLAEAVRIEIDSKAMRKFNDQNVLVGVLETAAEAGTTTMTAELNTRTLVKLS